MAGRGFAALAVACLFASISVERAYADAASDFYRGKSLTFVISTATGGGYDAYGRLLTRHIGPHIAPDGKMIVQNMPGAGGIRAIMYLHSVAAKDGTVMGMVHSGVPMAPALGIEEAKFDPNAINWIGSMNKEGMVCISWHESPIKTFDDTFTKEFIVGGSQMETYPLMMARMFNAKVRVISGYKSGSEVYLAMERGEVMGRCGNSMTSIRSVKPEWVEKHLINYVVQTSLEPDPALPGVPMLNDYAKTDRDRAVLEVIFASQLMDRPVLAPPGVPADRIKFLRAALKATIDDPELLADAKKQNLEIRYVSGEDVAALLKRVTSAPPDVLKTAAEALKEN